MTPETGFFLDFSDFNKKFYNLVKNAIPEDAERGAFDAMSALLEDSITKPPQAPKVIGDLWGSRIIEKVQESKKEISVIAGFNSKYAAYQHEGERKGGSHKVKKYTTDKGATQPGPKFMQSKMAMYFKEYIELVAKAIRRGAK